jgi:dsRNA-specific ribonuclease
MNTLLRSLVLTRPLLRTSQRTLATTTNVSAKQSISEEDAKKSAPLVALHHRLGLPTSFKLNTLAKCLTCRSAHTQYEDNYAFNILGKNFLSYYTTEYLLGQYPRLPIPILNAGVSAYVSSFSLLSVGKDLWGIDIDRTPALQKILNEEPKEYSLGKLRFVPIDSQQERGVTKLSGNKDELSAHNAYALAVRSIIGAHYASTNSEKSTKEFIYQHILSRKLDIESMFEFEQPTRELSKLCKRESLEKPVARLIAENGRSSNSPVYVVGVFSGEQKLGESYGSSLKEAKIRASVNALKNWYLYKPVEISVPSDDGYKPGIVDHGIVIV